MQVNEFEGAESGWDGNDYGGDPCPDGVYFYIYDAVADDGTIIKGNGAVHSSYEGINHDQISRN